MANHVNAKMNKTGIARQITRMRNVAKLTQPELAKVLEVNVRTLARWEGGESSPKDGILQEIARICHKINPNATIFQDMAFTPTEEDTWDISVAGSLSDALESTKTPAHNPKGGEIKKTPDHLSIKEQEEEMYRIKFEEAQSRIIDLLEENSSLKDQLTKKVPSRSKKAQNGG